MLAILAAVMLAAAPQHDTVFTAEGGRVIGTVVEESPQAVNIQLPDGSFRRLTRREVVRIEYADGSVSHRPPEPAPSPPVAAPQPQPQPPAYAPQGQPPPPPAYTPPPPPAYYPPAPGYGPRPMRPMPPPPAPWARPAGTGPLEPFWLSLGIGGMFHGGNVEPGYSMNGTFGPQMDLAFEGGFRLNPYLGLGLYADIGVGGEGNEATLRTACEANGGDCTSTTTRVGILLRHTFSPHSHTTPWLSVGTGFAHGSVDWSADGYGSSNVLEYSGWEMLRLNAGIDVRSNRVFGFGFYGGVAFTRFDERSDAGGTESLSKPTTSTMVQAGIRLTLFP